VEDGHVEVVERVAGERLNVAGEKRGWRLSGRLTMWTTVMVKYRRQHELGNASRHAPVDHASSRHLPDAIDRQLEKSR